jgi:hypothetical protein
MVTVMGAVLPVGRSAMFQWRFRLVQRWKHDKNLESEVREKQNEI